MNKSVWELDQEMNKLMEKFDWSDTNEEEETFLSNLAYDLAELMLMHNKGLEIMRLVAKYQE